METRAQPQQKHCLSTCPQTQSTTDAGEMAKTPGRPGLGVKGPTSSACAARGKFSISNNNNHHHHHHHLPACTRAASKALCKASPEAHLEANWIHSPTPAQPNRSFNPTFSLEWCLCSSCLSSLLSLCSHSAFLGRHCRVQESQSTLPEQQISILKCVSKHSSSLSLISLITLAVTCLKHLTINFHCPTGQILQKTNPFCL